MTSPLPATAMQRPAVDDSIAASDDLLLEFFDFFDQTISDVYAYVLHRTGEPAVAQDITMDLYFSLLQRKRFFWWRNIIHVPEIFSMAEKAITKAGNWQSAINGVNYLRSIANSLPGDTYDVRMERGRRILSAINKMPLREQKIAILQFFLGWKPAKAAKALQTKKDLIEEEYKRTVMRLVEQLEPENIFANVKVSNVLHDIHMPPLSDAKKVEMRVAILEKFRSAQMSSLRYVVPVAALLLITFSTGVVGVTAVDPISLQPSKRAIAAAETLLLADQMETYEILERAENTSRGIAAAYIERELANISLDLAGPAIDTQLALEKTVYTSLREMSSKLLLSDAWKNVVALLE